MHIVLGSEGVHHGAMAKNTNKIAVHRPKTLGLP